MSYKKAINVLPIDLLKRVQEYVDGEYLYIPRISGKAKEWGQSTRIREELEMRNRQIYKDHLDGTGTDCLAARYYLSSKSIQRIVRQQKIKNNKPMR